ncbi:MAG: hypothetical protein J1E29_04980 [Duncaniella sp.]|nr:hypothetical protein [Duncaniella sp.]
MVEKYKLYSGFLFTTLWVAILYGVVCMQIIPSLISFIPAIHLFIDISFLILGCSVIRHKHDIFILVSFLIIMFVSMFVNGESMVATLNGFRFYIPLLMSMPILRHILNSKNADRFVTSFDRQLHLFLYLQAVFLVQQFFVYGPCDWGGGTFSNGGSGLVSTLIYVISFYLLSKRWDFQRHWWANFKENIIYFILLFPTFLNETKVSFVYILAFFFLLLPIDRKFIWRVIALIPVMILLVIGLGSFYLNSMDSRFSNIFTTENIWHYLSGGDEMEELIEMAVRFEDEGLVAQDASVFAMDLPRFTKLFLLPDALDHTKGGDMLGAGVGQLKGRTILGLSPFARKYSWLLRGTVTSLFQILLELGIVGAIWMFYTLGSVLFTRSTSPFSKNIKIYIGLVWAVIMLYDLELFVAVPVFIMFFIALNGWQPQYRPTEEGPVPSPRLKM